ncbi:MAG: hypothetical protein AVDCRST_MAG04-3066 [uncultured Acetobacteraceae bacterium]|uniref:Uncharacterized protein n=1 Tax=uncultured Acetobacteraceae bacterium TaxID=169975 RepID=A0A6J4J977_9PROT|nr:MAG: hypothetical protein AVDCRST_MAG04-3066 [uncultured Acetobacteraceae bacterium]
MRDWSRPLLGSGVRPVNDRVPTLLAEALVAVPPPFPEQRMIRRP